MQKHARYGLLVKRVLILIEAWALIDKMTWCVEDATCIGAFKEYLYNISQSKLPATSLVAHAFVRGLSFSNDKNGWPRPNYQDEEQLWSAADDAVKGIRMFVGQQGIAVVWQEEDTPDFQQAPTSFDTIVS